MSGGERGGSPRERKPDDDPQVLDDGQEEVFAYGAVVRGIVEDPMALGPDDLARSPKSPGSLERPSGASPSTETDRPAGNVDSR